MKKILPFIFSEIFFKKIFAILLLILLILFFKDFLVLFLIIFIFSYLSLEVGEFLFSKIENFNERKKNKLSKFLKKYLTINTIVTILYIIFIALIFYIIVRIFPKIIEEISKLTKEMPRLLNQTQDAMGQIEKYIWINFGSKDLLKESIWKIDFKNTGENLFKYMQNTSWILLKFFLAIAMSYIFVIDRIEIKNFLEKMKRGNFSFIYHELKYFGEKITLSFGYIFKAQGIIAIVNAILTTIWLLVIGWIFGIEFPYIFTLSIIVLIFGFIPVLGTFLSGLPIVIIWYGIGGFPIVIAIIVMISLIHTIEAYILNPKIVSSYVHFPVFVTFATLIIAEHIFGVIGMLIWVPILAIMISIFGDLDKYISKIKREYYSQKNICEINTNEK